LILNPLFKNISVYKKCKIRIANIFKIMDIICDNKKPLFSGGYMHPAQPKRFHSFDEAPVQPAKNPDLSIPTSQTAPEKLRKYVTRTHPDPAIPAAAGLQNRVQAPQTPVAEPFFKKPLPIDGAKRQRLTSASRSTDQTDEAAKFLEQVESYKKQKNFASVIDACLNGLKLKHIQPVQEARLFDLLALAYNMTQVYNEAIAACQDGLKLEHDDLALRARLFRRLAFALNQTKQFNEAIAACQEGLKLKHDDQAQKARLFTCLAFALNEKTQLEKAIAATRDGLKLQHHDQSVKARLFGNLAAAFNMMKQFNEAIAACQDGLKLEHNDQDLKARLLYNLAFALYETKQFDNAIAACSEGLLLEYNDQALKAGLYSILGIALKGKGIVLT
jgi:tetratricopeptide (TPR) repeat protein